MVPELIQALGHVGLLVLVYVNIVFVIALMRADNSIMDIAWGLGFILIALYTLFLNGEYNALQVTVTAMVIIWGGRLSMHIYLRNRKKTEDFRYRNWRENWGDTFVLRSYLQVFLLQGFLMIVFSVPVILLNIRGTSGFSVSGGIGAAVWLFGFFWEAVADYQLRRFKTTSDKSGKIMTDGLWKYSRHPNYFGESVVWWGIWIVALSAPWGWVTVVSPALLTFFLLKVSGVPMLEKKYKDNPAYHKYRQRTNTFIPGPPQSSAD